MLQVVSDPVAHRAFPLAQRSGHPRLLRLAVPHRHPLFVSLQLLSFRATLRAPLVATLPLLVITPAP